MKPTVCRVCGGRFSRAALDNPNICLTCATTDWSQPAWEPAVGSHESTDLDHLLEFDTPTAVEWAAAQEEAVNAINEIAAAAEKDRAAPELHAGIK